MLKPSLPSGVRLETRRGRQCRRDGRSERSFSLSPRQMTNL
jgi:hypothetical protein